MQAPKWEDQVSGKVVLTMDDTLMVVQRRHGELQVLNMLTGRLFDMDVWDEDPIIQSLTWEEYRKQLQGY